MRGRRRVDVAKAMAQAVVIAGGVAWMIGEAAERLPATDVGSAGTESITALDWFEASKDRCNTVEVDQAVQPHLEEGVEWIGYQAACLALGGRIEEAHARIRALPVDDRWEASGVVFEVVHPAADAGNELAAGPAMELVVEYWPNHYMALYHAGAARFERGDQVEALNFLFSFLEHYANEDGWRARAMEMIEAMGGGHC